MQPKDVNAMNRRNFVTGGAAIARIASAGCLIETACASGTQASTVSSGPLLIASDRNAVVETTTGKVRGFTRNGIHTLIFDNTCEVKKDPDREVRKVVASALS